LIDNTKNNPMKRIFVLGAGASKADGLPMMNDLIEKCFLMHFGGKSKHGDYFLLGNISDPEKLNRFKNVFTLMDKWYKTSLVLTMDDYYKNEVSNPDLLTSNKSIINKKNLIEPFFSRLYSIAFENQKDDKISQDEAKKLFKDAEYFFYTPICKAQARSTENYQKFVKFLSQNTNSTIISFNYDLLLEKAFAILKTDLRSLPWNYCCTLYNKHKYKFKGPYKYLKLHGSFNWLYNRQENIFELNDVSPKLHAIEQNYNSEINEIVLMPPKFKKDITLKCLKEVWDVAEQELLNADEVYFIGYSFPEADDGAFELFKNTLGNRKLQKLVVVNPDRNVDKKIKTFIQLNEPETYDSFEEFLN